MYDTLIAFHILDLIQKSLERISFRFSDISCPDDFLLSESGMMKLDSICMKLTAIGESIKNLDKVTNKELLAQYPEIPWRYVMGVRDIIVHHYFDVDADEIYRICLEDIPQLQQAIKRMLDELTLNGRVTFNENQVAHVYPMFGGTVTELKAEIGDYVRKGDVLAVIRSGEVADYEKQLKEAEQQLLLARRNMDATQDMYNSGMASDKDVLQAKQELTSAEAEERRIKEVFSIYNFSGNAYYQLKSPVSGFIVEKQISRDMQLRPDQSEELFTISGLSDVWVLGR